MPLRYFHPKNGVTTLDHAGVEVPDINAARVEAVRTVATILHEDPMDSLWNGHPLKLWVTEGPGDTGETLLSLRITPEE